MRTVRKTAPQVKSGKVQKKNRHSYTTRMGYVLDRYRPGKGWQHVVSKKDIHRFTDIIPDWDKYAVGLEAIILTDNAEDCDGYYQFYYRERTGAIYLCPWPEDLWVTLSEDYFEEHRHIFQKLGVVDSIVKDGVMCYFTHNQAKAYSLIHVFVHELGHHVDRMSTKNQQTMPRGEAFAEKFANDRLDIIWSKYQALFQ